MGISFETIREALGSIGLCVKELSVTIQQGEIQVYDISCFAAPRVGKPRSRYEPKRILKSGDATIVFWKDGTKTIVKRSPDEAESDYAAFTAAVGIKMFGSNSALKRVVARTETQKPKKEKKKPDADSNYDQRKTDEWLDSIEKRRK